MSVLMTSLATLGILSVIIALIAAFASNVFGRRPVQAANQPIAAHGETVEISPTDKASVVRERYSVRLAPNKPNTAGSTLPTDKGAGTPSIEKIGVPAPAPQPKPSMTTPAPSGPTRPSIEAPFANEQSTAKEFETFRKALLLDDAIQINIALNDFTSMPDDLEVIVKRIANLWMQRHDVMNAVLPSLKAALVVKDPLTGSSGALVSGSRNGASISIGVGSHVVAWNRWSIRDISDMWESFTERSDFHPDIALCAATASWLAGDLVRSRMLAKKWTARATDMDKPLATSFLKLQGCAERWNGLLCWERAQTAIESGDASEQARCAAELRLLLQLGNQWVTPMVARLTTSASTDVTGVAKKHDDSASERFPASDSPQFPDVRLTGGWENTPKGARFPKDGAMDLDVSTAASALLVTITPQKLQGAIKIMAAPNEIVLDFDRAVVLIKSTAGIQQSVPITVYPRYENRIDIRFGTSRDLGFLAINHDQLIPLAQSNWRPKKITITAPQELYLLVNMIALQR